ncbi:ceramide-1-phosphate transfer protein-like, partial [Clarias magur]
MGVKGRAALAIIFIVVLLFSLWLYGNLDHCWDHCINNSIKTDQSISLHGNNTTSQEVTSQLKVCPGQKFQVSYLMMHLQAAPVSTDDVLLEPYLASWEELI